MDLPSFLMKRFKIVGQRHTDSQSSTTRASTTRSMHRRTLLELPVFGADDTHRRDAVHIDDTGIIVLIPVYRLSLGNELFRRVSFEHCSRSYSTLKFPVAILILQPATAEAGVVEADARNETKNRARPETQSMERAFPTPTQHSSFS